MTLQDQPVDELRGKIQDAVCPPSEHPTLGTMRLEDNAGIYRTGEFQIAGDFSNAISRLEKLIQAECNRARIAEHAVIFDRYAEFYNKISKKHGVNQPVPHTAFHQISEERLAELQQLMKEEKKDAN